MCIPCLLVYLIAGALLFAPFTNLRHSSLCSERRPAVDKPEVFFFVKGYQGAPVSVLPSAPVESGRTVSCLLKVIMKTAAISNHLSKFVGGVFEGKGENFRCLYSGGSAVLSQFFLERYLT